jgi:hypothetical protein
VMIITSAVTSYVLSEHTFDILTLYFNIF